MRHLLATIAITLILTPPAYAQERQRERSMPTIAPSQSITDIRAVAPVLGRFAEQDVIGTLWSRPQLTLRDEALSLWPR